MATPIGRTPDAAPGNWVERAPARFQPYLRLMRADRPIGIWLLYIPCLWGLALAAAQGHGGSRLLVLGALMGLGAIVMRGAGCVVNDLADRDIDAKVARTAARPLPSGEISPRAALAFLIALCFIGLLILLQFNRLTTMVGAASLALVAIYPFMKRITYWPQAFLGLTFNWGALVGYTAASDRLAAPALALYAAGIVWTMGYDTIYAHQDRDDDALIGVKSTALAFGPATQRWLIGFYALTIALFALAGGLIGASVFYFAALCPAAIHFIRQVKRLDIDDAPLCLRLFKSNREAGLLLLLAPICEALHSFPSTIGGIN